MICERSIQLAIVRDFRSSFCCAMPNYTPNGWWECDVWAVTKSGYAVEYEIKLTCADFMADRNKTRRDRYTKVEVGKIQELKEGRGPSRFYYVLGPGASDVRHQVPDHCGIIDAEIHRTHVRLRVARKAPSLHAEKVGRREITLAHRRAWFRYWNAIDDIERMKSDRTRMREPVNV